MLTATSEQRIKIKLRRPHPGQERAEAQAARFAVESNGRRWGKTHKAQRRMAKVALAGHPVGYFAPTYKLLMEAWRELKATLKPVTVRSNDTDKRLEVIGGGSIECWTLENEDAGRSRKYKHIVIDEAGLCPKLGAQWQEAIRATLTDLEGTADIVGTPKGRNFFWQMAQMGKDQANKEWSFYTAPTWENPFIPAAEIEKLRPGQPGGMTDRAWRQEICAEFLEDGGLVFRFVREAIGDSLAPYDHEKSYYAGLDLGKSEDYTVLIIMDGDKNVVSMDRFNGVRWALMKGRAANRLSEYGNPICYVDRTGIGDPVFEDLVAAELNVFGFSFNNQNKTGAVEGLAMAFEQGEITIPDDEEMISELESFEVESLPSGRVRYQAPEGAHDDIVCALMLANHAVNQGHAYDGAPGTMREQLEQVLGMKIPRRNLEEIAMEKAGVGLREPRNEWERYGLEEV